LQDIEGPARVLARVRGGTLLIDEIADISEEVQARIARMMDAPGEYTPRFLATSQSDLAAAMKEGRLRRDLYYRLSGATVHVPALRDRVEDIELLARHFLDRAEGGTSGRELSEGASRVFTTYQWPGNVRQLEHAMRQLALTSRAAEISQAEAEQVLGTQPAPEPIHAEANTERLGASVERHLRRYFDQHGGELPPPGLYARILREIEVPLIDISLAATSGNQAKCADLLGINRNTLRKKITELDIEVTRGRKMM
ncbi:MAG: sigma 54-interacting transcriptional regulator, partial [Gammaproteobacteria bacterium]|nr:sigma 54-interacting transcriptional regulator [Gammaproteobacteria bacterium]